LHLSSIPRAIRAGARVVQGQTIGRVGATGLATGPHLHYRLSRNGRFINPLVEHRRMPPAEPVSPEQFAGFVAVRDAAVASLAGSEPVTRMATR
jgi:murein DD-endopeptidase MepM/ murein hydrolase activator NlpD